MSKVPTKEDKARIKALLELWKDRLFLNMWNIRVTLVDVDAPDETIADIESHHEYYDADLRIFPIFWTLPAKRQEATIVHELVHAVISPVASGYEDMAEGKLVSQTSFGKLNESVTEHITNILLRAKLDIDLD